MRLVAIGIAVAASSACQVDIRIDVAADDTGAGLIQVTVDVDAEAVTLVPGIAEDIRFDDLVAGGWTIEGPLQVNNGGLRVIIRYPFESPAEATLALRQISGPNGPLLQPELKRTVDGRLVSTTLDATLQLVGGLNTFSDLALTTALGAPPWTSAAQRIGVENPTESVSVTLVARLPGTVKKSTGTQAEGGVVWTATADGAAQSVVVGAVSERVDGGFWPVLARTSGTILGYWLIIVGIAIFAFALIGRRRPSRRTRRPAGPRGPRESSRPGDGRESRGVGDPSDRWDRHDPLIIRPPASQAGPVPRRDPPLDRSDWRTTPDF